MKIEKRISDDELENEIQNLHREIEVRRVKQAELQSQGNYGEREFSKYPSREVYNKPEKGVSLKNFVYGIIILGIYALLTAVIILEVQILLWIKVFGS